MSCSDIISEGFQCAGDIKEILITDFFYVQKNIDKNIFEKRCSLYEERFL